MWNAVAVENGIFQLQIMGSRACRTVKSKEKCDTRRQRFWMDTVSGRVHDGCQH